MTAGLPIRLLMLEDNPHDAELIDRHLRRAQLEFSASIVDDEEGFRSMLENGDPDVILSDYHLPGFDGVAALRIARTLAPSTPFIFVSGSIGEERAVEALREGATDYVLKDRLSRLASAIVRALAERRERSLRLQLEHQLEQIRRIESLGRVAATVAHEFNNVLMGIAPAAELMARIPPTDQSMKRISLLISDSIARGRRLTEQILSFSKPAEPESIPIVLSEWLDYLAPELRALVGDLVTVEVNTSASSTAVVAIDRPQMQQVLSNLVVNAGYAMPNGGMITIGAETEGDSVVLTLTDDGTGMPPDVLDRIFEPLFTTKRSGTGLGLAVAQQIVARHHGSIHVASSPGVGTTFRIVLPLAHIDAMRCTVAQQ